MTSLSLMLLADLTLKASAVLSVTAVAACGMRRASAASRHLVWTVGLAGALAIPLVSISVPQWRVPLVHISSATARLEPAAPQASRDDQATLAAIPPVAQFHAAVATEDAAPIAAARKANSSWVVDTRLLMLVWLAGALLIVARLCVGFAAVAWMTRRTRRATGAPWLADALAIARQLELTNVRFLRGRAASMPMACGILRPAVLMPADADGWPPERLRVVVLHELAHVKRRDCLTHAIAQLACALHWFNPLAWIAARRLRVERERACDDLVLRAGTRRTEYADQLLEIARVMQGGRFPAVLGGATLAMAHRSQLEGRLMAILDPRVPHRGLSRARVVVAVAAGVLIIVPLATVQPWAQTQSDDHKLPAQSVVSTPPAVQASPDPQPHRIKRADRAVRPDDINRMADDIRASIREGVGAGIGTGVGVGADIASGVVASVVQSVTTGVAGGLTGGVSGGVTSGIVEGVTDGVTGIVDGITSAVQDAAQSAGDSTPRARQQSTTRDERERDPRAAAALIEALKDSDKDVRDTALSALVNMRDPRVLEPLMSALKDSDADIRQKAAFGLGQLRDARAIEPLTGALHDSVPDVRQQAAFALGQIRDRRAAAPLASALKDENADVRQQAAFALGQLRDPSAVDPLVIALNDSNVNVREQVVFALGQLRDPRAIDGLT
ncbi:MAG: HEAT repeat domain-containing protein, partial [Vicinamibacterales bacterium]